jgi:hypothetical protein
VWDILWVFFSANPIEMIPPLWEHHLGSGTHLYIAKGQSLDEHFLCFCLDEKLQPREYSYFLAVPGEEPLHVSSSFSFGALDEHLVVVFLGGIVPLNIVKT